MSKFPIIREAEIYRNDSAGVLVYKGLIPGPNTPVAVKEQSFSSVSEANKGLQEAFTALRLRHENILQVYDCAVEMMSDGMYRTVLVMELMVGDLYQAVTQRHQLWSEAELLSMLVQVVSALSYAERLGITHRDIKPQNLFTDSTQSLVKVGDFGSATATDLYGIRRSTLVGSPFYLSPQQKLALSTLYTDPTSPITFDPYKSDVYALGVTFLYLAMLTPPRPLAELHDLERNTQELLLNIGHYGVLQWYLGWMLAVEETNRPYFQQIEGSLTQYGYIPGQVMHINSQKSEAEADVSGGSQDQARFDGQFPVENAVKPVEIGCLGCSASLKKPGPGRVTLPCGHKFHDENCFFAFLTKENNEFWDEKIKIVCPNCHQVVENYANLLISAFKSLDNFQKRREKTRKTYCFACHSKENLDYRQDCGHRYCLEHVGTKTCRFCHYKLREI